MNKSDSLKILRVAAVPDNRLGGMSRTMYCTGDCLHNLGHQVDFLFRDAFSWNTPRQLQRYVMSWEASSIVRKKLAAGNQWDIVELHEPLALAYARQRAKHRKLPPAVIFSYGNECRSYSAMVKYRSLKKIPFSIKSRITSGLLAYQASLGAKYASHIICSNQEDIDFLHNVKRISKSRLTRHHSGIEDSFLEAGSSIQNRPAKGMLFVGNWSERKGVLDLVPAVSNVLAKNPDAFFTIAGTNMPPEEVLPNFASEIRDQISVIPNVDNQDRLIEIYSGHSVFLLPSYFEGHPLVMVEAAAMGLAIVTTPICGMLDFIVDGQSGRFVPVGDWEALSRATEELICNPILARKLGASAHKVARRHTWATTTQRIEAAYFAALSEP